MSKRAEEAAIRKYPIFLEYYPKIPSSTCGPDGFAPTVKDHNAYARQLFQEGYEQAEKDTIERAIAWLKANAVNYIYNYTDSYPDAPFRATIGGKCWEDLKKAMEEEE